MTSIPCDDPDAPSIKRSNGERPARSPRRNAQRATRNRKTNTNTRSSSSSSSSDSNNAHRSTARGTHRLGVLVLLATCPAAGQPVEQGHPTEGGLSRRKGGSGERETCKTVSSGRGERWTIDCVGATGRRNLVRGGCWLGLGDVRSVLRVELGVVALTCRGRLGRFDSIRFAANCTLW